MSMAMRMVLAPPIMSAAAAARGAARGRCARRAGRSRAMAADYPRRMATPAALPTDPGPYGPTGRSAWMDIDWRAHRRFVEVDGRQVNVVEMGVGDPPIVFVHGLAGSWQNWLANMPQFRGGGHRVVAFDLPGFGLSEMPREKISIRDYGRLVDALLDRLGVGPAVLVGNSMGGFIATEVAIQFPARVERLVLVSAAGLTIEYQRDERILGMLRFGQRLLMAW